MPNTVNLVESRTEFLYLTDDQIRELARLSKDLAGSSSWWGETDFESERERGVIKIEPRGDSQYSVTVLDAVGAIGLPDLTLIVEPKIPAKHFSFIAEWAFRSTPRSDNARTKLEAGINFTDLVAGWFLNQIELILRRGLLSDYRSISKTIPTARGRILALETSSRWLRGDARVDCQFDTFDTDTSINRVIKAALLNISRSNAMSLNSKKRSSFCLRHMQEVGTLRADDLLVRTNRESKQFEVALYFARQILTSTGRELAAGQLDSQSFLFKTPDLIENGIRAILTNALAPMHIEKRGRVLKPSTVSVNPDLEIGPPPFTGDVKYKYSTSYWNRTDLAQSVFFATAYESPKALVISFTPSSDLKLPKLTVGKVSVTSATWNASADTSPQQSAKSLIEQVRSFASELLEI